MSGLHREGKVLLALLLATVLVVPSTYLYVASYNQDRAQAEFDRVVSGASEDIRLRVSSYEFGARGARGAIVASGPDQVSREQFLDYMSTRDLPTEFPGALGFGYIRRVPREQLSQFLAAAKADSFPQFSLRELDAHAGDHYVIQYIEPSGANHEAIGLDIGSEANRRLAADRAMSSGLATLTEPITLVQATGKPARGFLLLLPVYDPGAPAETPAQRQRALTGWSYAPLIIDDVLNHIGATLDDFSLSIRDPDSDDVTEPFYRSVRPVYDAAPHSRRSLALFGRQWEMDFTASQSFANGLGLVDPSIPAGLLLALGLLSALSARYYFSASRMRQHVQQGRARTDALLNQSQDAILELDPNWHVLQANAAAEQMFGPLANQGANRPLFNFLALVEGETQLRQTLKAAALDTEQDPQEVLVRDAQGAESRNVAVVMAVRSQDGDITGFSLTLRDVSRQRAVEETLSEISVLTSSQLGEEFMQAAADALGRLLKAKLVTIDRLDPEHPGEAFVLAAYREGANIGPWRYATQAAASSQATPSLGTPMGGSARGLDGRALFDPAGRLPTPLADMKATSCISISLRDTEHHRIGHLAVFHGPSAVPRDFEREFEVARLFSHRVEAEMRRMTAEQDRRHAQTELREVNESLERLAAQRTTELRHTLIVQEKIVAGAGVALIATDPDGIITLFNPAAESLLGRAASDLVGKQSPAIFHDSAEIEARAAELAKSLGRPFPPGFEVFTHGVGPDQASSRDWTYVHSSGERIPVLLGISQLKDDDGTVLGYLGVAVDMRAKREQAEILKRAVERSEAAARAKSEFLANVSHEIRTPMNAILGMMQLLAGTPLELRQKEYVRKSQGASHSLLSILNDVLDYSKIEAGMMVVEKQPFSLQILLSELSIICEGLASNPDVEIAFDLDPRLPDGFLGDALRLKQVLTNLLGNAMKFTEAGLILLAIRPVTSADDIWQVEFSVLDTGIGIPKELQSHIFGSFAQAEANTARRYGGTGLGLSICDRLVGMMGGRMSLRSVPAEGSTFSFTLALESCGSPAKAPEPLGLSILLFEAGEVSRNIVQAYCRRLGCSITSIESIQATAEHLSRSACDILILGVGAQAADKDRLLLELIAKHQSQIRRGTLVLASGSRQGIFLEVEAMGLERVHCMPKPVLFAQMKSALDMLADGSDAVPPGPASMIPGDALAGIRVLVIEDNVINRDVVRDLLQAEGAEVTLCETGQDALAQLDRQPEWPSVVLTDIQMPGLDGFEVARRIRRDPRFTALPILALTAHASASDRAACRAAGMDEHVAKPLDIADLRRKILACVDPKRNGPAIATGPEREVDGMTAAARRLGGHPTAYARVLEGFISHSPDLLQTIVDPDAPLSDRARAAHTLKGNSATAGQDALAELAQAAEASLRSDQRIDPALAGTLESALEQGIAAAQAYLDKHLGQVEPAPTPGTALTPSEIMDRLTELDALLAQCNMRALQVAEAVARGWPAPQPEHLAQLLALAQRFDFDGARLCCARLVPLAREVAP